MKRLSILLLVFLLLLTACTNTKSSEPYTVELDGKKFIVDTENNIITENEDIYRYVIAGSHTTIIYPNGATYNWTTHENGGTGGWSDDYNASRYVDGDTLMNIIENLQPKQTTPKSGMVIAVSLIAAICGVANIIEPKIAWYLNYGWRFKDAEPSNAALTFGRVSGFILVVLALILILI